MKSMKTKNEIAQYEEVFARNPVTGELQKVRIEKPEQKTPEQVAEDIREQLGEMGLQPTEAVEVEDPLTGKRSIISIDRTGHNEKKLIQVLADPNTTRDRKDYALSMYLFERGSHNTSMLMDLFRYKGAHTKETRVFKSQIRFDFQMFADDFAKHLLRQSELIGIMLEVDIKEERNKFEAWLALENNKGKGYTYRDYVISRADAGGIDIKSRPHYALIQMAIHDLDESETLARRVRSLAEAREREKGKGIYLSADGRPYTADDPSVDEAIKADREATAAAKKDE